ncbi:MAG: (deoxy)nucleoside triphosphate pyrophosphohydrolase [Prolixibacteraceae bacterium]
MIEVCCAIVQKEDKFLAVQRGPESSHPFQWEFPGGKTDPDETAELCIIREIQEELSVEIEVLSELNCVDFDYGNKQVHLIPFVCRIISGKITLTEHLSMQWFSLNDWELISWSKADEHLIRENLNALKKLKSKKV